MSKGITKKSIKIYDLLKLYKKRQVIIQPSFQREFVWKTKQQKNLIKSISKAIPLPYFYFAKTENSFLEVIDGQQRLITIFGYVNSKNILRGLKQAREKLSKEFVKEKFRIDNVDYYKKDTLKILKKTKLDVVVIDESKWDINKKYEMFEILNQGGTRLSAQELRHCTLERVNPDLNKYLEKGAKKLDRLIGKKEHLYNEELVLRFFVINKNGLGDHKVSNDLEPKKLEHLERDDLKKLFNRFTRFIRKTETLYPKPKIYISDGEKVTKPFYFKTLKHGIRQPRTDNLEDYTYSQDINQSLFHLLSYYIPKYDENKFNKISIKKKRTYLLNFLKKDRYIKTLTGAGTDSPNKIKKQMKLFEKIVISNMGDYTEKEPRQITSEEKETLLRKFNYCYLCYDKIRNPKKVVPEHIGPFKRGFMSKFYNILLACKKCNGKKLAKSLDEYRSTTHSLKRRLRHKKNIKHYLKELEGWNSKYKLKWYKQLVRFAEGDNKLKKEILS